METLQSFTDRLTPDQLELYIAILNEFQRYRDLSHEEKIKLIKDIMDRPYLDLLCDWAFKHVFSNNLKIMEMLLRDILQMDLIVEQTLPNEIDKFQPDDKNILMDVICKLPDGRTVVVEMQQEKREGFKDRMFYYGAANFVKKLKRGEKYTEVRAVYVVCFVNFKMQHIECPPGKIIYTYEFREKEICELYGDYISLNFCELPRLAKDSFQDMNPKEEWFHLLKNMRNFALNPKGVPERLQTVLEASRSNSLPDHQQLQYFRAMVSDTEKQQIATANYQDGFEEGMKTGLEQGLAQGAEQQALETARRMREMGLGEEIIIQATGLTEEQVRAL